MRSASRGRISPASPWGAPPRSAWRNDIRIGWTGSSAAIRRASRRRRAASNGRRPEVLKANPPHLDEVRQMIRTTPVNGFIGCAAALADHDYAAAVATVTRPVLFLVGEKGAAAPPMRKLNEALPGSRYVELGGAGHISNLDQPAAFTRAVADFLSGK